MPQLTSAERTSTDPSLLRRLVSQRGHFDDAQLAVLLREVQWEIDSMAFDLPAGRGTPERRALLADVLVKLADVLRPPLVISTETSSSSTPSGTEVRGS